MNKTGVYYSKFFNDTVGHNWLNYTMSILNNTLI